MTNLTFRLTESESELVEELGNDEARFEITCHLEFNDSLPNGSDLELIEFELDDDWLGSGEIGIATFKQYFDSKDYINFINEAIKKHDNLSVEKINQLREEEGLKPFDQVQDKDLWFESDASVEFEEVDLEDLPINEKIPYSTQNITISQGFSGSFDYDNTSDDLMFLDTVTGLEDYLEQLADSQEEEINLGQKGFVEIKEA